MARKSKGIVFILLGCLLLLAAGGWYLYNVFEDVNAGKQAIGILEKLEEKQKDVNEFAETPVIFVEGEAFCGKIVIKKLGVELPVYDEWSYERLKSAPCRYTGSVKTDDIIIAAHNYKSHFGNLKQMQIGDTVTFIDVYGNIINYEICETVLLDGTAVSDMRSGGWDLTLFTCTRGGKQRVTVRCNRISEQ